MLSYVFSSTGNGYFAEQAFEETWFYVMGNNIASWNGNVKRSCGLRWESKRRSVEGG